MHTPLQVSGDFASSPPKQNLYGDWDDWQCLNEWFEVNTGKISLQEQDNLLHQNFLFLLHHHHSHMAIRIVICDNRGCTKRVLSVLKNISRRVLYTNGWFQNSSEKRYSRSFIQLLCWTICPPFPLIIWSALEFFIFHTFSKFQYSQLRSLVISFLLDEI